MARTTPAHAARWPLAILIFTHAVSGQFLNVVSNVSQNIQVATEQTWEGATLSFCIDTTGSMYDDLLQVRNGVRNIFRAISEQQEIPIVNYALVTFHDPEVNLATLTADQATFENAVEASLEVHGGGDCPEMAVGGINLALRRSLPRSFIFVFTYASAKDYQLKTQALSLIQETQSQVIFVLTGDCNDQSGEGFRAFKDIAAASAGQIFFLRQKNEVAEVLKFIEISVNARQVNILSMETRPGAARYQIPVDGSLQQLIVSVSTNTTTGVNVRLPDVRVTSPNGQEFFPTVDLGSVVVINITKPAVGWWNLFVDSPLPYSVRVKGVSLLDFKIHFTVASGTQRVFITRPVEGQSSFIVLQPSDAAGHLLVTGMQLINLAGTVIHDIPLNWTTSNPYPRLAHPGFEAPQQLFYVRVQGIDSQNMTFYRLTPTPVQPGLPSPPTVIDWLTDISGELGGSVQLRCDYRSLVQASAVWCRDGVPIDTISRTDPRFLVLADGKLLITRLSLNDANCYRCQVVSIAGNDTGRPVCLEVLQPPRITQPAQGQCNTSVVPGNGFQLQCRASGDPTPTISWQKDGIKIESTSRMRVFSNGLLRGRQALPGDDGRYTCVAENGVRRPDTRDCYILLMTASSFTSVSDVIAIVGQRAILICLSDGSPTPQITWWDGQDRIRNTSRITSLPSGILNISRVELGDEGSYTCVASNPAGRRSSTGFLTIHVPPEIVVAPDPLYVRSVDSEFRLLCVASGKPDPVTIWLFNNRPVDQSRVRVNSNTLTVSRLSVADEGSYTCLANNDAGTTNSTTALIVQGNFQ
ncbi:hemicentin-2-like [Sycon ciliatum]|uniref:hemicentin-2-like n=1 Tax=Sycon ciliatum TaxID=27933 RepID=UPI0031F6099A